MYNPKKLVTIKEASLWASQFLRKEVSESNISYLIQYGKVQKHNGANTIYIKIEDLRNYYNSYLETKESHWKKKLGEDLNWALSFDQLREKDTTKHVHRLHPYKGKFIPQLVEYFVDTHTDKFKKDVYFQAGDILLDPFCGSGTTLVQSQEMRMHAIGIDVSHFNCMIAECKMSKYNLHLLESELNKIKKAIIHYESDNYIAQFEQELTDKLSQYNNKYFPSPDFKYDLEKGNIEEDIYAKDKEKQFLKIYVNLLHKHTVKLEQTSSRSFLDKWYIKSIRNEIDFVFNLIKKIDDSQIKKIAAIILSRTIRSCRATTHSDLATLKEPQLTTYYCYKHKKICKPIYSIKSWFARYAADTVTRLRTFENFKSDAYYTIIPNDSRTVNIFNEVKKRNSGFYRELINKKISGIFTSPPYVGQIDYHEQHAYAYELFGFERKDELEIGPLYKGQGAKAKESYVKGISQVLLNCKKFLKNDYNVFIVANDKHNLYPQIADKSGMEIINRFKRPVLNRTERDKSPYSEIIFHLKDKK